MTRDKHLTPEEQQQAAQKRVENKRAANARRQEAKARANVEKGLTARGTPRSPRGTGRRRQG